MGIIMHSDKASFARQWRRVTASGLVAVTLVLSGCVLAPGQELALGPWSSSGEPEADVDVVLRPVTAEVVATLMREQTDARLDPRLAALVDYKPSGYLIGAGDILGITVWDHPELTAPVPGTQSNPEVNGRQVRADGTIFYPYIGPVPAAGKSVDELRQLITKRLATYVQAPQIDINILRFASQKVFLSGAFQRAQALPISAVPLSLADALGQAGIDLATADLSGLTVQRDGDTTPVDLDALARVGQSLGAIFLKAGDQIHLPYADRKKVYVMGEVLQQRAVPFRLSYISLADALQSAGGISQETSKASRVYVIREGSVSSAGRRQVDIFQVNANRVESLAYSQRFPLRSGDVVFVAAAEVTRWNRVIGQLLATSTLSRNISQTGGN